MSMPRVAMGGSGALAMAQILVLGAPDEGCAGKHGRSIPLAVIQQFRASWPVLVANVYDMWINGSAVGQRLSRRT
jgi:hypothetical protein